MPIYSRPKKIIIVAILFALISVSSIFAKEPQPLLSQLQKQARDYRNQGLEYQRAGNLDGAMSMYQKAIELDPAYAAPYNDLGVLMEAGGLPERAEECYLQAIKIDPNFLSAYSNLALVYENKRDLEKAATCWRKRIELGAADDPWTQKAQQRLEDINLILSSTSPQEKREEEILGVMSDVMLKKAELKKDDRALARDYLAKAKVSYEKGDEVLAFKQAVDAQQLDPQNTEIEKFIDKVQTRILSR